MWVFFILLLKPSEIHCKEFKMFDKQQPINLNMTIYETISLSVTIVQKRGSTIYQE